MAAADRPVSKTIKSQSLPTNGPVPVQAVEFDPRLFLKTLKTGRTSREYAGEENIFAQGDAADAVFYIQTGKVKLTVVSKRGKEAVVAILTEASFFGEGCLAGQPLRMSTASSVLPSTVIRVDKSVMLELLHQNQKFAEQFLAYV